MGQGGEVALEGVGRHYRMEMFDCHGRKPET